LTERARRPKAPHELRKFGFVMAGAFAVLGALAAWRGRPPGPYLLALAVVFLVPALVSPRLLAPIERAWMTLAEAIGSVMTVVILTLAFLVVFTPMGIMLRLLGKDLLGLKPDRKLRTYWTPVEADGPATRPDKPF
jgi:hypothetical protein